ncbi:MAG: 3-deoxy-D-manno-octulosonic acid transferase [Gammaproteobacteria bacterium]|nr:3-deoxy-D-manno-octulosonic acid transferase [Gammaproteobacteria bacterium]
MRYLYTLLALPVVIFFELRLWWCACWSKQANHSWRQRLGQTPVFSVPPIWLHAVSVGEVQAVLPLLKRIIDRYPDTPVLVTTMTSTGADRLKQSLGEHVTHSYIPYDLPFAVKRFIRRSQPCIGLIMETEIWPNLYHYAAQHSIPLMLINARLSQRSAHSYRRFRGLTSSTLGCLDMIAAQAAADAERFISLGVPRERVVMTGNVKFDISIAPSQLEEAEAIRRIWGSNRSIWIAASTHEGEDEQVLEAFNLVRKIVPQTLLVLVPRHPERFDRVEALCQDRDLNLVRRSSGAVCDDDTHVFFGDTMGELNMFYAAADVAFVGGSLVPIGGHNLLEPAAVGLPVIIGPYTHNFEYISELLLDKGAARRVMDANELGLAVIEFLKEPNLRDDAGEQGRLVIEQNRGAVEAVKTLIAKRLDVIVGN